jgi:hypothetical protein
MPDLDLTQPAIVFWMTGSVITRFERLSDAIQAIMVLSQDEFDRVDPQKDRHLAMDDIRSIARRFSLTCACLKSSSVWVRQPLPLRQWTTQSEDDVDGLYRPAAELVCSCRSFHGEVHLKSSSITTARKRSAEHCW